MTKRFLIILATAFNPSSSHTTAFGVERINQYIEGLGQVAEVVRQHPVFDVVLVDNTISPDFIFPPQLLSAIQSIPHMMTVYFFDNTLASKNKGCGNIVAWRRVLEAVDTQKYDYIIHFEPRCRLENFSFFDRFLARPDNYFKIERYRLTAATKPWFVRLALKIIPVYRNEFWTGLLSVETKLLQKFVADVDLENMAESRISLEKITYQQLMGPAIKVVPRLGVVWHNAYSGRDDYF